MKNKVSSKVIIIAAALFQSVAGLNHLSAQEQIPLSQQEIQDLGIIFEPVVAVSDSDGERVPATIITAPDANNSVSAWFDGLLLSWEVAPGETIAEGTPVATVSSESYREAQQDYLDARIESNQAQISLDRDQRLFDAGIIAEVRLEETRRQQQQAELAYRSKRQHLLNAGASQADLDRLNAGTVTLGEYRVRSPLSGTVARRYATAGDHIDEGAQLLSIANTSEVWLLARAPSYLSTSLTPGQTLTLSESGESLAIQSIDRQVDTRTQSIGVYATFSGNTEWLPGQQVSVRLPPSSQGMRVPDSSVVHNGHETTVYVRTANGAEARTLILQPAGRNYVATQGLSASEQIVTRGTAVLKGIQLGLGGTE